MNARRGIISGLIMAAAVAALPAGGPDTAQALGTETEKVRKTVVKFSDLNLHTEKDAKKLLGRIKRAAVRVCGGNSGTPRAYVRRSRASYRKCVKDSESRARDTLIANLGNRAKNALTEGDLEKADDMHRRALTLHKVLEQKEKMAVHLDKLSEIAVMRGDFGGAESWREQAFTLNEELGRRDQALADLDKLGWIAAERGDMEAARTHYRRALALSAELHRTDDMARHIRNLGIIEWREGKYETAEALHRSSLALYQNTGNREGVARSLADLAQLARSRGNNEAAEEYHHNALSLHSELGRKRQMVIQHANLWPLALEQNRFDEAEVHLQQAVRLAREAGMTNELSALGEEQVGLLRLARGRPSEACAAWGRAHAIYKQIGKEAETARVRDMMRDKKCPADGQQDPSLTAALQLDLHTDEQGR
ncbi:MAG: UrcA family protein [Alphaproteobacteria bacterium]